MALEVLTDSFNKRIYRLGAVVEDAIAYLFNARPIEGPWNRNALCTYVVNASVD